MRKKKLRKNREFVSFTSSGEEGREFRYPKMGASGKNSKIWMLMEGSGGGRERRGGGYYGSEK